MNVTYEHLLEAIGHRLNNDRPMRILDAGCGKGAFLHLAQEKYSGSETAPELYGFDLADHGVQGEGFIKEAISYLGGDFCDIDWANRLQQVNTGDAWPYPDGYFDMVVTNQVLEHVKDISQFLSQLRRVLRPNGTSVHIFPLRHVLYEWHLRLPFAHKFRSHALRRSYIRGLSGAGIGIYDRRAPIEEFSNAHSDYISAWTGYSSWREFADACSALGLRVDYGTTYEFYARRLRRAGLRLPSLGGPTKHAFSRAAFFHVAKYVSGVCIEVAHANSYDPDWRRSLDHCPTR